MELFKEIIKYKKPEKSYQEKTKCGQRKRAEEIIIFN